MLELVELKATSHVTTASDRTKSIRTTVPRPVVERLNIKTTDVLEWTLSERGTVATVRNLGTPEITYRKDR
jgi:hypothetical protein